MTINLVFRCRKTHNQEKGKIALVIAQPIRFENIKITQRIDAVVVNGTFTKETLQKFITDAERNRYKNSSLWATP